MGRVGWKAAPQPRRFQRARPPVFRLRGAHARRRPWSRGCGVGKGELLVLIPRCLSKGALDGVLAIAGRYDVPVFVATRGQLARRVIRERRPRAVVAVACERDMMTGLRDVAGKLPVLGLTMRLPNGPCRDAELDLERMDAW